IIRSGYIDKVDTNDFIHKCYIECARTIYNNPELFWHDFPSLEIKRNQRETYEIIRIAIPEAIRKLLPIELILKEYLSDNDETQKISNDKYITVKNMVENDITGAK